MPDTTTPETPTLPTYRINPDSLNITLYVNEQDGLSYLPDLNFTDSAGEHYFSLHLCSGKRGMNADLTNAEKRHANILMVRRIGLALKLMYELEKAGVINPANFTNENSIAVQLTGHKHLAPANLSF